MSVTHDTSQCSIFPYLAVAAAASARYLVATLTAGKVDAIRHARPSAMNQRPRTPTLQLHAVQQCACQWHSRQRGDTSDSLVAASCTRAKAGTRVKRARKNTATHCRVQTASPHGVPARTDSLTACLRRSLVNGSPGSNPLAVLPHVSARWLAAATAEGVAAAIVAGVAAVALVCACVELEERSRWVGVWGSWLIAAGAGPGVASARTCAPRMGARKRKRERGPHES